MCNALRDNRIIRILLTCLLALCLVVPTALPAQAASSSTNATGKVKAKTVYLKAKPSNKSKNLKKLRKNTKVVITQEVFDNRKSTKAKDRWYAVKAKGRKGYIRANKVKSVKYKKTIKYATQTFNYRTGPSTSFPKKGQFKKGDKIIIVAKAKIKGTNYKWYKIKKGGRYYYASALYMSSKKPTAKKTTKKTTLSVAESKSTIVTKTPKSTIVKTAVLETGVEDVEIPGTDIKVTGLRYPKKLAQGSPFSVMGIVTSTVPIDHVKVGVVDSSGNWLISNEADGGDTTFDIFTLDAYIKFGLLSTGTFKYKVIVTSSGSDYCAGTYTFKVFKPKGPSSLASTATAFAYPPGTSASQYTYGTGKPVPAYADALDTVFPRHSSWGKVAGSGASCDVFISTVCRASGVDPAVPQGVTSQWSHYANSDKWMRVNYSYSETDLQSGDIIIYKKTNGNWHVCMYVVQNGKGYVVEASYTRKLYGYFNSSLTKILRSSDKKQLRVYRAVS